MEEEEVDGFGSMSESDEDAPQKEKVKSSKQPNKKKKSSRRAEKAMSSIASDWNSSAAQMVSREIAGSTIERKSDYLVFLRKKSSCLYFCSK